MRVGYVVHTYPAPSHAFIQREVLGLRACGVDVLTLSIHRPSSEQLLTAVDQEEGESSESILPPSFTQLLRSHLSALRHPGAYVKTLRYALTQAPSGARARLWQCFYFAEAMVIWSWARRNRLDHLHAHLANVATDGVWLASVYDRSIRPADTWHWSFTMHGPTEFYAIERFNLARKVAAADTVVCISDFCRSQLMLLSSPESWEKLIVVHCGADLARYRYRAPRTVDDRELKVVCVGRMVARKGQAVLLDAIKRLSDAEGDAPRISLTLVGSGPAEEHLRAQAARLSIEDRVRFVGAVGQDEMPHVMDTHDVFCLVSLAEGVPVVLMEAMAVGLPVVTTPIAGIPELVDDEESGLLVPPGRPDALAGVLARLAADAGLRERLSHTARKRVEADFDSGQCASQLAQAFAELAQVPISLELVQGSGEQNLLHDL